MAVADDSCELTYAEFNQAAEALAQRLASLPLVADDASLVGIRMERGVGMIVAVLAVHKAGHGYVPISLLFPPDRRAFILENSGAGA